jgi:hypothetical protein
VTREEHKPHFPSCEAASHLMDRQASSMLLGLSRVSLVHRPSVLSFSEACAYASLPLLERIWRSSCSSPAERTCTWSLNNFLRSDPHYHRWQFSLSLEVAAKRGDLAMVQWLFSHFSELRWPESSRSSSQESTVRDTDVPVDVRECQGGN